MEAGHGPLEDALQLADSRIRRPPGYHNGRLLGPCESVAMSGQMRHHRDVIMMRQQFWHSSDASIASTAFLSLELFTCILLHRMGRGHFLSNCPESPTSKIHPI
jgi:hypothetical protein